MEGQPEAKPISLAERLRGSRIASMLADWQGKGVKRTKFQAFYRQKPKITSATCDKCIWFVPGPNGMNSCRLVACKDEPDAGRISASGSCSLWNAAAARIRIEDFLRGRGDGVQGVALGNLRVRAEQLLVKGEATTPPPEVQDRMFLKGKALEAMREAATPDPPAMQSMPEVPQQESSPSPPSPPPQRGQKPKYDKTELLRMV